jgi:plasmid stabilization system protein ParE
LGERLIDEALQLATFPERHAIHDRRRGIRKMPLAPYLVFYTCDKAHHVVNVLHFWHGAQRPPKFS